MNDEDLQLLWQNQAIPELGADVATLVATARDQHRKLQRTIFWRDFREVGVAIVLIPIWIYLGVQNHALWTRYLMVPALLFVAGFMVIDRLRRKPPASPPSEAMVDALGMTLSEVEHQIWLLRNVQWWYLAPLIGALIIDAAADLVLGADGSMVGFLTILAFDVLLGIAVWWLNQYAVRRTLEPRRDEVKSLLERLSDQVGKANG